MDSLCGKECFSYKAERLFLLASAMVSSKEAKQIAPLKSPSSSLAATRAACQVLQGVLGALFVVIPGALLGRSESASSLNRRSQDGSSLFDVTVLRIAASFLEEELQEARRILFKIFAVEHGGSNKEHGRGSAIWS